MVSVKNKIVEPYDEIERQCNILMRLHDTSEILRCVIQVQQLAKIIEKQDDLKTSALIKEVGEENFWNNRSLEPLIINFIPCVYLWFLFTDEFCEDIDLSGIRCLENDTKVIEKRRTQIQTNTKTSLLDSLKDQNESQVEYSFIWPTHRNSHLHFNDIWHFFRFLFAFKSC